MADLADIAQEDDELNISGAIMNALRPPAGSELMPVWENGVPYCRVCGDVIPAARIKALPETGLCVDCANLAQAGRLDIRTV